MAESRLRDIQLTVREQLNNIDSVPNNNNIQNSKPAFNNLLRKNSQMVMVTRQILDVTSGHTVLTIMVRRCN